VSSFPIPFVSQATISGGEAGAYIVGAMFTEAYEPKAQRLAASCEEFGLQYELHKIPAVHRATSARGTEDVAYTKANFIRSLLAAHKKPVLYVDADCLFVSPPDLIDHLARSGCDFAIYNWLADSCTDQFFPVELSPTAGEPPRRFYRFVGNVAWSSDSQLACSGCVQFYGDTFAARALLRRWHRTVVAFPHTADDYSMDFTFNNLPKWSWPAKFLKAHWLPKAYARIPWWILTEPVVNHPEFPSPSSDFAPIQDPKGRERYYFSRMQRREPGSIFPRDCVIDTEKRIIYSLKDGMLSPIQTTDREFWL